MWKRVLLIMKIQRRRMVLCHQMKKYLRAKCLCLQMSRMPMMRMRFRMKRSRLKSWQMKMIRFTQRKMWFWKRQMFLGRVPIIQFRMM